MGERGDMNGNGWYEGGGSHGIGKTDVPDISVGHDGSQEWREDC